MASEIEFKEVDCPVVAPQSLASLAEKAAAQLTARGDTVTVFDATCGGLIFAALLAVPGASKYATCAGNHISSKKSKQILGDSVVADLTANKVADGAAYKESKRQAVLRVAREMRQAVGATWCVAESGACGPTFNFEGISNGFSAICVSGPIERCVFVESSSADREGNMWGFTKVALDLLAETIAAAPAVSGENAAPADVIIDGKEDRFAGVTVEMPADCKASAADFAGELKECLTKWRADSKRGLWFKVPIQCSQFVPPLTAAGFAFHHAKPEYVMMCRWLEDSPSKLPRYGFTQIGVGGVVANSKGEVLMVQERINPDPRFQGLWKLPGGLADPGEDLGTTAAREVLEETGVKSEFGGVVSMRHSHGARFGQGDLYCVVKLRAVADEINIDPEEIAQAEWMSLERVAALVPKEEKATLDGCVTATTYRIIEQAFGNQCIVGALVPTTRGTPSMMYTATDLAESKI